jgi:hypothetical protein
MCAHDIDTDVQYFVLRYFDHKIANNSLLRILVLLVGDPFVSLMYNHVSTPPFYRDHLWTLRGRELTPDNTMRVMTEKEKAKT